MSWPWSHAFVCVLLWNQRAFLVSCDNRTMLRRSLAALHFFTALRFKNVHFGPVTRCLGGHIYQICRSLIARAVPA